MRKWEKREPLLTKTSCLFNLSGNEGKYRKKKPKYGGLKPFTTDSKSKQVWPSQGPLITDG